MHRTLTKPTLTLALAVTLLVPRAARADEPKRPSPFAFRLAIDLPVTLTATVLWILPSVANRGLPGSACDPCDREGLNALDRAVVGNHSPTADVAGDVLAGALPLLAAAAGLLHVPRYGWRSVAEDTLLIIESMTITGVLSQIVRHAVRRPRPFMYEADARGTDARRDIEATLSFYSGHTATVFAAASAFTTIFFVRRPRSPLRWLVLAGALVAASVMPMTRVMSGEHFATDVLVGAAVGAGFGMLVPMLHVAQRARPAARRAHLLLSATRRGAVAGLRGAF